MLRIGDFSRMGRVTVKALRFYDEIGLLKPNHVDEWSNYRYYSVDQLGRLNRILALKELGIPLEEIGRLLQSEVSPKDLRRMLESKQEEIRLRIEQETELLSRVEARLALIEKENQMADYDVVVKQVEPVTVASIREVIPAYNQIGRLYGELFPKVGRWVAGPPMAIWHDPEFKEHDVDAEAAVPVRGNPQSNGRIQVRDLEAVSTMASLVHKGSYQTLNQAYAALMAWIDANGYRPSGPAREVYLYAGNGKNVRQDDESYVTELQLPVAKA